MQSLNKKTFSYYHSCIKKILLLYEIIKEYTKLLYKTKTLRK